MPVLPKFVSFEIHDPIISPHDAILNELESEAIWALRECAGAFSRPVLLYSIGKDSTALLHLARKAFAPGPLPFTVLHVDTTWKFGEMIAFRNRLSAEWDVPIQVRTNPAGAAENITPFTRTADEYTRVMKTETLRAALTGTSTSPGIFDVLEVLGREESLARLRDQAST
jgi:sulfate adenylyltransferase subunit 2